MRKIVVAVVVLSMAFVVAGCGGGEADQAADTTGDEGAVVAAAPAAPEPAPDDRSPIEAGYPAPFPVITSTEIPSAIQQKLDDGRPMAVFFYDGTQVVTTDQRAELDAALAEYRGLIDLVTFNLANAAGVTSSSDVQVAAMIATDLGISGTPYIMLVDGNGLVTWRYKGYIDREIIGREVLRATE